MSNQSMKALVYTANQKVIYRDEPQPELNPGEALIKVHLAGICGSDMHAYLGHDERRVPPLILGHEVVGVVIEGKQPGKRVVLNPLITCGVCQYCLSGRQNLCAQRDIIGMYRAGAFAEFVVMPEENLVYLPDNVSFEQAVLAEPGATALHAVLLAENNIARPISEVKVLVIGGGSIGLLTALILVDKGAHVDLQEINQLRKQTLEQHINCNVFDSLDDKEDSSYDIVFDAVGNMHTRNNSVKYVKPGGTIVHIGLMDSAGELDIRKITLQEISVIGCYTYTKADFIATIKKISSGALGDLSWTDIRPISQGAQAFQDLFNGQCSAPKVLLDINN